MADILIVDDDDDLRSTVAEVLELSGHHARVARNGEEGLLALEGGLPELILLDIEMPVLDGPAMAYRAAVTNAGRERIPIVVTSGYADIENVADRIGTPYYLPKPCSIELLTKLIEQALAEKRPPHPAGIEVTACGR